MSDTVIKVENLSKQYRLGIWGSGSLVRDFQSWWAVKRGKEDPNSKITETGLERYNGNRIWALKGVSFNVQQGELVGIIGKNGAGKSTLLKILTKVTSPTSGMVKIKGRVASLLEVGTGFHPELTGRENIYLNGSILGMRKNEIKQRFDEIVAFSEIERYIDTPVKRYSSGMYVRLAFAVAAHLEPEILLVDEVLAVGDVAFQKKCLGKMKDVAKGGRTVLFVSHNMAAVENLCRRGIFLYDGKVRYMGSQEEAITEYLRSFAGDKVNLRDRTDRTGSGLVRVVGIEFKDLNGNVLDSVNCGNDLDIYLYFEAAPGLHKKRIIASLMIKTQLDVPVFLHHNRLTRDNFGILPKFGAFVCRLKRLPLTPSIYNISLSIMVDGEYLDSISYAAELTVVAGDFFGSGEIPPSSHGLCLVEGQWRVVSDYSVSTEEVKV